MKFHNLKLRVGKNIKPERCEKAIFAYINTSFRIDKDLESQISYLVDYVMAR